MKDDDPVAGQSYDQRQAEEYAALDLSDGACEANITRRLLHELEMLAPAGRVVDAGCGNGRWYDAVVRAGAASSYLGVDISKEMLARFPSERPIPTTLVERDVCQELAARPGQADLVLSVFNAICFADPAPLVGACLEALRPGGSLLLATNVHFPAGVAPLHWASTPEIPVSLDLDPFVLHGVEDGSHRGLLFHHTLSLGDGQEVALDDFFHTLLDYAKPLCEGPCHVKRSRLFAPQGDYCDGVAHAQGQGLSYAKLLVLAQRT
jgi:SAM-dependent methyltransferase